MFRVGKIVGIVRRCQCTTQLHSRKHVDRVASFRHECDFEPLRNPESVRMAGRRIRRVFDDQRPRMGVRTEFFHQKHADQILLVLLVDLNQNLLHIRVRVGDDDGSVSFLVRIVLDQRVQKHGITQTDGRRNVNRHVASAHRVRYDAPQSDDVEKQIHSRNVFGRLGRDGFSDLGKQLNP